MVRNLMLGVMLVMLIISTSMADVFTPVTVSDSNTGYRALEYGPLVANFDTDPSSEYVVTECGRIYSSLNDPNYDGHLYFIDDDGGTPLEIDIHTPLEDAFAFLHFNYVNLHTPPCAGDVDGDGILDIIISVYGYRSYDNYFDDDAHIGPICPFNIGHTGASYAECWHRIAYYLVYSYTGSNIVLKDSIVSLAANSEVGPATLLAYDWDQDGDDEIVLFGYRTPPPHRHVNVW